MSIDNYNGNNDFQTDKTEEKRIFKIEMFKKSGHSFEKESIVSIT